MDFNFEKESKKPLLMKIFIEVFIWAAEIAAVIFLAYFIVYYALERTDMVGISMEGTLQNDDQIIINKFSYRFGDPERFDVIVFQQSGKEHSYYDIKRIIALPGEKLLIKDDIIYINDEPLKEAVNVEPMANYGLAEEEIVLEENEYFVLGDNRNNSEDSRFASVGMIRRNDIIGKAFLRMKPFNFVSKLNLIKEGSKESNTVTGQPEPSAAASDTSNSK